MTFENKGLEKNTASVAFGFGTSDFHTGGRAEEEEGKLPGWNDRSILGPAPFKFYPDDVAADIGAADVTMHRGTSHYPVPHRYSA